MYKFSNFFLPVDFNNKDKNSKKINIATAHKAKQHLNNEGVLIIFPSGGVSIAKNLKSIAIDDDWKLFPAKLIHQTKTDILPIYFDGKNGVLFHLFASKIRSQTLKYSSYIHETRKKIGKEIHIYPGDVINFGEVEKYKDRLELTRFLKDLTYKLKEIN